MQERRSFALAHRPQDIDRVRRTPFFVVAGEAAMTLLLRTSVIRHIPRGTVLFEQQGSADVLYLLLEGSVGLAARSEEGTETVIEIFGPGELFLVPAAILRLPYLTSATALTDVRVLLIPAEAFRDSVAQDAALGRAIIELLARHWRLMVEQVVDLKLRPADRRVARFLARRVSEEAGAGSADLPEPRGAIAARLGMTPETLSRTLAAMEADGLIRNSGKRVDVPDREKLLRYRRG
jgi:CRP-like cAMP-binding protein